ncbi:MAG: glycosyltransferase [Beijerinckiaceae bacterium]
MGVAHFACIVPPFLGHIDPMAAIAQALIARGHRATFLHMADAAPLMASRKLDFVAVGRSSHPPGTYDALVGNITKVRGLLRARRVVHDVAGITDMLCRELPDAIRAIGADMILADQAEAAGGLVSFRLGLPSASIAAALPLNWESGLPPAYVGLGYGEGHWKRIRNIAAARGAERFFRPLNEVIEAYSTAWGFGSRKSLAETWSGYAQISQLTPSLDFPRKSLMGAFHYVGPLRAARATYGDFVMPPLDERPLAYVSLGSVFGFHLPLLRVITRGFLRLGLQVIVTHGGRLSEKEARSLNGAHVFDFVHQPPVLSRAAIAMTHGGLNTVLDAMSAATPMIIAPFAFEQGAIAARVAHAGAGRAISRRFLTSRRVAHIARGILDEPSYQAAADRIAAEVRALGGAQRAAHIIEQVLGTGQPVYIREDHPDRLAAIELGWLR